MSTTINRSSRKPGRGVISAITIASTASGTASWPSVSSGRLLTQSGQSPAGLGAAMALDGVTLAGHPSVHQFENISQDLGYRAIEMRRNFLADLDRFVERLRQRRIFDDRHLVLDGLLADAQRQAIHTFRKDRESVV